MKMFNDSYGEITGQSFPSAIMCLLLSQHKLMQEKVLLQRAIYMDRKALEGKVKNYGSDNYA
jgi:hypothetical protein